jgi:hypothetical protein
VDFLCKPFQRTRYSGKNETYQIVRAGCLIAMTVCPYFLPEPWNSVTIGLGLAGLIVSIFLKPREIF